MVDHLPPQLSPNPNPLTFKSFPIQRLLQNEELRDHFLLTALDTPELRELRYVASAKDMRIDFVDEHYQRFNLVVRGVAWTPLVFDLRGANYVLNSASVEAFVQNPQFYERVYLDGLKNNPTTKSYFSSLKAELSRLPEEHIVGIFKRLKESGMSWSVLDGSVQESHIAALVEALRYMSLARFAHYLGDQKSFVELSAARMKHWNPFIFSLNPDSGLIGEIRSLIDQNNGAGRNLNEFDVETKIVSPLLLHGCKSPKYREVLMNYIENVYMLMLSKPNVSIDDFKAAVKFAIAGFAKYAAHLDDDILDKINYADPTDKNSKEGLRRLAYFKDLADLYLTDFPECKVKPKEYSEWSGPVDLPLDAFEHDMSKRPSAGQEIDRLTPFEKEYFDRFNLAIGAISRYRGAYSTRIGGVRNGNFTGLYKRVFGIASNNSSRAHKELLPFANKPRSEQNNRIRELVGKYEDHLFDDANVSYYWMDIDWRNKAKGVWHRLNN